MFFIKVIYLSGIDVVKLFKLKNHGTFTSALLVETTFLSRAYYLIWYMCEVNEMQQTTSTTKYRSNI